MSLELSGTTPAIKGVAGSVSAPAITGDDVDTGISFPAADTIKFSAGGVEKLAITASGLSGDGSGLSGIGGGITVAQTFRQTATSATNNSAATFTSNWEKSDGTGEGGYGSFADPSSGVFTFPTTGFYYVTFSSYFEDSGYSTNCYIQIQATTDNSSYSTISSTHFGTQYDQSGNNYQMGFVTAILDVTDVTQVKVKFRAFSNSTVSWDASSTQNRTYATFVRLGDT